MDAAPCEQVEVAHQQGFVDDAEQGDGRLFAVVLQAVLQDELSGDIAVEALPEAEPPVGAEADTPGRIVGLGSE